MIAQKWNRFCCVSGLDRKTGATDSKHVLFFLKNTKLKVLNALGWSGVIFCKAG